MPRGEWTAADYRRDAEEQQVEHNDAMRAELMDDRDAYFDEVDDTSIPTRIEVEMDEREAMRRY